MNGRGRALLRLFSVQGSWNYERMQGIGMGYAAEPLLGDLRRSDPARHAEAVARSAEFFNANPYLAGLALGAAARAEYEGVPGEQVARLRTALAGPLGALGDGLFWAGILPATAGAAVAAVALGAGWWAVLGFFAVFNAFRVVTTAWGLRTGIDTGMRVGGAISASAVPRAATKSGAVAAFAVGTATPIVAAWLLDPFGARGVASAVLIAAAGLLLARWSGARFTAPRFGLLALAATILLRLVMA